MHEQAGYAIKYHVVVIFPTRAEQFKQQYKKQKTKNKNNKNNNQTDKYYPWHVAWVSDLSPLITSSWPDQPALILKIVNSRLEET